MAQRADELSNLSAVHSTEPDRSPQSYLSIFQSIEPLMATQISNGTWSSTLNQERLRKCQELVWRYIGPLGYDMSQLTHRRSPYVPWSITAESMLAPQVEVLSADSQITTQETLCLIEVYIKFLSLVEYPCPWRGANGIQRLCYFQKGALLHLEQVEQIHVRELGLRREFPRFVRRRSTKFLIQAN